MFRETWDFLHFIQHLEQGQTHSSYSDEFHEFIHEKHFA